MTIPRALSLLVSPAPGVLAFVLACLLAGSPAHAASIVDPGFGRFGFTGGPWELSGLTRVADDQYLGVGDTGAPLVPLAVDVDRATGAITSVTPGAPVPLAGGVDLEGIAWDPTTGTVLVSDETGPAIRRHDPATGALLGTIPVPAVFSGYRSNRSLESLARDPVTGALWTANEDALLADGPAMTLGAGSTVRLQRFDAAGESDGQWAYPTSGIPGGPLVGQETGGVVDLLALPSGELLVMERTLSSLLFRVSIYQVDFDGATDTSGLASLASDPFVPVTKTLLWTSPSVLDNYEGLALGPRLDDGSYSLLLVADDNGGGQQALYPLRITFVPEPGTATMLLVALAGLAIPRRR